MERAEGPGVGWVFRILFSLFNYLYQLVPTQIQAIYFAYSNKFFNNLQQFEALLIKEVCNMQSTLIKRPREDKFA